MLVTRIYSTDLTEKFCFINIRPGTNKFIFISIFHSIPNSYFNHRTKLIIFLFCVLTFNYDLIHGFRSILWIHRVDNENVIKPSDFVRFLKYDKV